MVGTLIVTALEEIEAAAIVTEDTAVEAATMTMVAGSDTTTVTGMTIHAANEGISPLDYGIGLLGGSLSLLHHSISNARVSGARSYHSVALPADFGKVAFHRYPRTLSTRFELQFSISSSISRAASPINDQR